MQKGKKILAEEEIKAIVEQLSEDVRKTMDSRNLVIVGIRRRGVELARRIQRKLQGSGGEIPFGTLDITLYRDDLSTVSVQPVVQRTELLLDLTGRDILLVDDVLYTGRTIRSALSELVDFGRPRRVRLLVLIDRGHRELPIQPDYTGRFIQTEGRQFVEVRLKEIDGEDKVLLID